MKLAVCMDPLERINPIKDSTIAMLERAQSMGWSCVYFTPKTLYAEAGSVYAAVSDVEILDRHRSSWVKIGNKRAINLAEMDVILIRQDPPVDMVYLYVTQLLELVERTGVLVSNKPQSLRDANEKLFTLQFANCCPETLVSASIEQLKAFWKTHGRVIFKPLHAMGGHSIFYVDERGQNLTVILALMTENESVPIMAQVYIPEICTHGDKRILLIHGEPVPFALARIPQSGDLRGNLAAGARGEVVPITDRDRWICGQLAPTLRRKGLAFVGIDVIGEYLTEINVTSPTCIREIEAQTGLDIAGDYLNFLAAAKSAV